MRALEHTEVQELLGAYALDALDAAEADQVEHHLRDCPRCRAEVQDFREAASMLAFVGQEAPPGLWARIVENLEEKPPPLELARVVPLRESAWRRLGGRMLAAAAVVISVVALAVSLTGSPRGSDANNPALATVLANPATKLVHLVSAEGAARAEVAMLGGKGYLVSHRLPALSRDKTYQLWAVSGEQKISLGILGNAPRVGEFAAAGDFDALAVTVERRGGAAAPTTNPVAAGSIPVA